MTAMRRTCPISKALDGSSLVALSLNGEPLPVAHGGPVRLVVPGYYGTNSTKWLTELRLSGHRSAGAFTTRYYMDPPSTSSPTADAGVGTGAQLAVLSPRPMARRILASRWKSGAGPGPRSRSPPSRSPPTAAMTWATARVADRIDYGWQRFSLPWTPSCLGEHILACRAATRDGKTQPATARRNRIYQRLIFVTTGGGMSNIVTIAGAHLEPVLLDKTATLTKSVAAIAEAAGQGARLVAFPESFIPGFPVWAALRAPIYNHELFARFVQNSLYVDGPEIEELRRAARRHEIVVSMGFSERNPASLGSVWNSNVLIGADGNVLSHHRKIVPTFYEKLIWTPGDGHGLRVVATPIGRLGVLICGENTNPLAQVHADGRGGAAAHLYLPAVVADQGSRVRRPELRSGERDQDPRRGARVRSQGIQPRRLRGLR